MESSKDHEQTTEKKSTVECYEEKGTGKIVSEDDLEE